VNNILKIKRYADDVKSPVYSTKGAACFDVHAYSYESSRSFNVAISEEDTAVFGTGLFFEIPEGKALMVYSRSGQAFKSDVSLSNCVGVIDSDYTGELMVKLRKDRNIDNGYREAEPFVVEPGDRIAQCMLVDAPQVKFEFVTEIHQTERADKGLGSTGYSERIVS
jgi:dUTP pyrophosphatase